MTGLSLGSSLATGCPLFFGPGEVTGVLGMGSEVCEEFGRYESSESRRDKLHYLGGQHSLAGVH